MAARLAPFPSQIEPPAQPAQRLGLLAASLLAALALMACGGSEAAPAAPAAPPEPAPAATAAPAPAATPASAPADSGGKPTIRLADALWESLWINNAIAEFIITHGYGYPVEQVSSSFIISRQSLANGDVDILMEMWQQNWLDYYTEQTDAGNIVNLGPTFQDGGQFFAIPRWMHEQYGITTIEDMKGEVIVDGNPTPVWELFKDPEDPAKGLFVNCVVGWVCQEINDAKLAAYGLAEYYNSLPPGSGGIDAALAGPAKKNKPVFAYLWEPHYLMGAFEWHVLEEPAFTTACWEGTDPNVPRYACAYETVPIDKGVSKHLPEKAPDVAAMLRRMDVGLKALNRTAAWANANAIQGEWEKVALHYLETYEDRWTTWVDADKVGKIKAAVRAARGG